MMGFLETEDGMSGPSSDKNYCSAKYLATFIGKQECHCINVCFRNNRLAPVGAVPTKCRVVGREIAPLKYFLSPAVKDRKIFDPAALGSAPDVEDLVLPIAVWGEGIGDVYRRNGWCCHEGAGWVDDRCDIIRSAAVTGIVVEHHTGNDVAV